ncbi:DUF4328 domain-containing protein [Streptomyces sp. NPDC005322]
MPGGYPAAPAMGMPTSGVDLRRGLSTTLTVLFGLMIPTLILVLIGRGDQYGVVSDMLDNASQVTIDDANDADDFYLGMSLINGLVALPTVVVWAIWFRRLRLNGEVFAPGQHRFSSGWAAGSWFTPVVNFWFPKQIANDIWRASSPHGPHHVRRGLLNGWWVTFLASAGVGFIGSIQYTVADNKLAQMEEDAKRGDFSGVSDARSVIEDMKSALGISMFATMIAIAAAILALLLVRQITAMQEQRASLPPQMGAPSPYGSPAPSPYGTPAPGPMGYGAPQMPPGQPGQPYPPYGQG